VNAVHRQSGPHNELADSLGDRGRGDRVPVFAREHQTVVDVCTAPCKPCGVLLQPVAKERVDDASVEVNHTARAQ
jgi:hypothetical protein